VTRALVRDRLTRPVPTAAVLCVLAALAIGDLHLYRAGRPCGVGIGDPQDAVSGVLTAIRGGDDQSLCQRLESSCTLPVQQVEVLLRRMRAAGEAEDLEVTELEDQQMGAEHVLPVTSGGG
jgi:hypothetical protein